MSAKQSISDALLMDELITNFEAGRTGKTDLCRVFMASYKIGKGRFYPAYDKAYADWFEKKKDAQDEGIHQNTIAALQSGLKSKLQRQLEIQKILEVGTTKETIYDFTAKKAVTYSRALTPSEIKNLHAELSKMAGDYAPAQIEGKHQVVEFPKEFVFQTITSPVPISEDNDEQ